jgi:CRP-like cAMP-binding protein
MYDAPRAASVVCCTNVKAWSVDRLTFRTMLMQGAKRRRELYQEFLASVPLLQNLDRYERLKVADALTAESFKDGEVIIKQNDEGDKFYLILEGQVRVEKNGVETHNSPLEPWQYFGELALLGDEKRQATCYGVGHVVLASMDRASFDALLGPIRDILARNKEAYDPSSNSTLLPLQMIHRSVRKNAVSSETVTEDDEFIGDNAGNNQQLTERSEVELTLLERSLGGSHMMSNLDVHGRRQVYNSMKKEYFGPGEDVIKQGDTVADKFYVVISGELTVLKDDVKVAAYDVGGVFGELALM